MKGFMIILLATVVISSVAGSTYSTTKTDDIQGLGEFQSMVLLAGQPDAGSCYACSAPCAVAGKGCCSNTIYKQCRQIDGVACRCTQR